MTNKTARHRTIALVLCMALATSACASARWTSAARSLPSAPDQRVDPMVMAEYVQKLPLGTTVKVDQVGGKSLRGTLMKATDRSLIIQPKTRIPEPPVEIALADVLRVSPEGSNGASVGKAIGAGVAAGAGAALAVFFVIIAAFD